MWFICLQFDSDATTSDADAVVLLTPLFSLGQCLYRVCVFIVVHECLCMWDGKQQSGTCIF